MAGIKIFTVASVICMALTGCGRKTAADPDIAVGDLVFTELCASELEQAIASVTQGAEGYSFTHVGIVCEENARLGVLEAAPPEVTITPLEDFLAAENGMAKRWAVGRLKPPYRPLIPSAIEEGRKLIGYDYDFAYLYGNDRYYCSELIYEILKSANGGREVFPLVEMTFKVPGADEFAPGWEEHYAGLGMDIPEGEPGTNPGAMSRSDIIDIIKTGISE